MANLESRFKSDLLELFDDIIKSIDGFSFMINHQEYHLDGLISKIKNDIDIQREELIEKIQKTSNEMIKKLDIYFDECKRNFLKLNYKTSEQNEQLKELKNDLIRKKNDVNSLDDIKTNQMIDEIKICLKNNKSKVRQFENELKLNQDLKFDPVHFDLPQDIFGKLLIRDVDFEPNEKIGKISKSFFHDCYDYYTCLELIENSGKLAVGNKKGKIKIFNLNKSECILILDGHSGAISYLISISKKILVSSSVDCVIKIWDLDKIECIRTLNDHERRVTCFCLNSSKDKLFSGSMDKSIKIWNLNNYSCIHTLTGHEDTIKCIKINSRNQLISACDDKTIKIWNINKFVCEKTIETHEPDITVISIEICKNDDIMSLFNDTVKIWDSISGKCIRSFRIFDNLYIDTCYLKLINENLFLTIENISYGIYQFKMKLWDLTQDSCLHEMNYNGNLIDLRILNNGNVVYLNENMDTSHKYFHSVKIINMA